MRRRSSKSIVTATTVVAVSASFALYIAHQGNLLQLVMPVSTALIGGMLLREKPAAYIRLVFWSWFLSAFVRRVVDDRCGFVDQNLIIATPMLVSGISVLGLWDRRSTLFKSKELMPFILCLAGFFYGFCVHLLLKPSPKLAYAVLQWASPICFGLYLALYPERALLYRKVVTSTLLQGLLGLGLYGLYQFFVMPSWDVYWLTNVMVASDATSFGRAEPGQLRVWSTLNAPGIFAVVLVTGMVLLFFYKSRWKVLAMLLATVNLGLTLIRTEWIGLVLALALLVFSLDRRQLFRYALTLVLFCACLPVLTFIPAIDKVVNERIETFKDPSSDTSYQDRREASEQATRMLLANPLGTEHLSESKVDNGFLDMLLSLGLPGGLAYLSGVIWLLLSPSRYRRCHSPFLKSCHARAFALIVTLLSGNILIELPGALLWICLALYATGEPTQAELGIETQSTSSTLNRSLDYA